MLLSSSRPEEHHSSEPASRWRCHSPKIQRTLTPDKPRLTRLQKQKWPQWIASKLKRLFKTLNEKTTNSTLQHFNTPVFCRESSAALSERRGIRTSLLFLTHNFIHIFLTHIKFIQFYEKAATASNEKVILTPLISARCSDFSLKCLRTRRFRTGRSVHISYGARWQVTSGTYPSIPDSFVLMIYRNISKVWNMLFLPWIHRKRKELRNQVTDEKSQQYFT